MIEEIKWWEWPVEKITKNIEIFKLTGDVLNNKLKELLQPIAVIYDDL